MPRPGASGGIANPSSIRMPVLRIEFHGIINDASDNRALSALAAVRERNATRAPEGFVQEPIVCLSTDAW
jgi:hypothetical protein